LRVFPLKRKGRGARRQTLEEPTCPAAFRRPRLARVRQKKALPTFLPLGFVAFDFSAIGDSGAEIADLLMLLTACKVAHGDESRRSRRRRKRHPPLESGLSIKKQTAPLPGISSKLLYCRYSSATILADSSETTQLGDLHRATKSSYTPSVFSPYQSIVDGWRLRGDHRRACRALRSYQR
jgi:hypothetical protein